MKRLLLPLSAMALSACAHTTETMIGPSAGLSQLPERSMDAAALAALSGAPVYQTKHWLLGGDHVITTSSGSNYQHAQSQSFKDAMQTVGTVATGFFGMKVALAKEVTERFLQGQITERMKAEFMKDIALAETEAELATVTAELAAAASQ